MREGPDPRDSVYKLVASALLKEMRKVCAEARDNCNELEETWPKEMRIHPVHSGMAEGVLYMPRAAQSVVLFQTMARENEDGEWDTITAAFVPATLDILHLGIDYMKRAEHHVNTCICGHVIPQFTHIPIHIGIEGAEDFDMDDEDDDEEVCDDCDPEEIKTADDLRVAGMHHDIEIEYACPACGYKPNKRYK